MTEITITLDELSAAMEDEWDSSYAHPRELAVNVFARLRERKLFAEKVRPLTAEEIADLHARSDQFPRRKL